MAINRTLPHPRHHEFTELPSIGISALRISGGLSEGQLWQTLRALQLLDIEISDARALLPATSPSLPYDAFTSQMNRIGGGLAIQQSKAIARWCVEMFDLLQIPDVIGDVSADISRKLTASGLPLQTKRALDKILWPLTLVPSGPALPQDGLRWALDGSVATSFYSDLAKTTNSVEGGDVAVWEDQSGNGNDWVQVITFNRPKAGLTNGRLDNNNPTSGSSAGQHLVGPDISGWTEGSFFARAQSPTSTQGGIWGTTAWNSSNSANHWNFSGTHYMCFGMNSRRSTSAAPFDTDLINYEENISAAGDFEARVNGSLIHSVGGQTVNFRSTPVLGSGIRVGGVQYSGNFKFYKKCGYNRIVTPAERIIINAWLES